MSIIDVDSFKLIFINRVTKQDPVIETITTCNKINTVPLRNYIQSSINTVKHDIAYKNTTKTDINI